MWNKIQRIYIGTNLVRPSGWTPWSNTLAYRPLTSSTTVNDQSWNWMNFTNTNVTFWTYKWVDCAYFSWDNGCQLRNTSFPNWRDRDWTVSCWNYYISNGRTANGNYDQLLWWWGQQWVRRDCYSSPYNKLLQSWCTGYTLTSDSWWLHTVSTFNSTTKVFKYYVNWSLHSSFTYSSGSTSYQNMFTMSNSNDQTNAAYKRWKWGASELIVETNKIRNASEITTYYNQTKSKYGL